jgi:hypothetical protein
MDCFINILVIILFQSYYNFFPLKSKLYNLLLDLKATYIFINLADIFQVLQLNVTDFAS